MQRIDGRVEQEKLGSLPGTVELRLHMTALPIEAGEYLADNGLGGIQSWVRFNKVAGLLQLFGDNMHSYPSTLSMS
jgi:hypothetical protein